MNFIKKIGLLALLLATTLQAAPPNFATTVANLNAATTRLKAVAPDVKDAHTKKLIQDALKSAEFIARAGKRGSAEMAKKALMKVQKVLGVIAQQQKPHATHKHAYFSSSSSTSSSSSSSCDVCSEINEVASEVRECCEDIQNEINVIISTVETLFPCEMSTPINSVPIVINESGKYCVVRDLVYNGPNAAITVTADNVTINFANHSLTLTDQNAQGVLAQGVNEFTLENDIIKGSSVFQTDTSAAVHLVNVQKALLTDLYTKNTTTGIWIEGSTDVMIQNCLLDSHESSPSRPGLTALPLGFTNGAGLWVTASNGVTVDGCVFEALKLEQSDEYRSNTAILVEEQSENFTVKNSSFDGWLSTLFFPSVDGLLVDHCEAIAHIFSPYQLLQLGGCSEGNEANDVIIRNSLFRKGPSEATFFDGLLLLSGSGCLLENVVVDATCLTSEDAPRVAALHIGFDECGSYSNVLAKNCVFTGLSINTVLIDDGSKVTIEESQIDSDNGTALYMRNASDCLVKNCVIRGLSSGVVLDTTGKNAIMNNQVYGSYDTGILVLDNVGNHISGNTVYDNNYGIVITIIPETPVLTETYFNTSCNNFSNDCIGVFPAQAPGVPASAGSNVCCDEGE